MLSSRLMTRRGFRAATKFRKSPGWSSDITGSFSSLPRGTASVLSEDEQGHERHMLDHLSTRHAPREMKSYQEGSQSSWLSMHNGEFSVLPDAGSNLKFSRRLFTSVASRDTFNVSSLNQLRSYDHQCPVGINKYLSPQLCWKRFLHSATLRTLSDFNQPSNQLQSVTLSRAVQRADFSTDGQPKKPSSSTEKTSTAPDTISSTTGSAGLAPKKSIPQQIQDAVTSATKAVVNFLVKLPGWTFFYLTHPTELRKALHSIWEAVKHEAHHYWMGTKLLYADVQTAGKLFNRTLQGSSLTRRERKQLLRTVSDIFRLVPFSMFIIIPFMEFALPLALRIFPNMLPSTFQDSLKAEENMKRELQSRIAMAQFFQETLQEMAKEQKKIATNRLQNAVGSEKEETVKQEQSAAAMLDFLGKARSGEILPADVIIQFASHFHDDLTLDNMPRMQLINMCRYMNIPPYGSDNFLRFQLRHKIRTLIEDDQRILWEGIGSLTKMELREACQERGMRSTGLSREAYRRALQQWLDLSVNKNVPISLLIMSRSFFLREEMTARGSDDDGSKALAGLADAISGLDQNIVNEVVLEVATSEEKKSDPEIRKIKLEVIEAQNERILEEQQQREAANKKKEQQEKDKHEQGVAAAAQAIETEAIVSASETSTESLMPKADEKKNDDEDLLSTQEMDAISQLINSDPVTKEREELEKIKAAMLGAHSEEEKKELEKLKSSIVNAAGDVVSWGDGEKMYSNQAMDRVTANMDVKSDPTDAAVDLADSSARASDERFEADTIPSTKPEDDVGREIKQVEEKAVSGDHDLDRTYASLKARVARMVDKIESQLDSVEEKIGDKLHFLDKDGDGILDLVEMADALQRVLKRTLSQEEAMAIAALMDENKDGVFTVDEFKRWIETSKIVQLVKDGQDGDLDRLLRKHSVNHKEDDQTTPTPS